MPTAITHDPSFTTPVSSTNTALVRWSGTGGDTLLDSTILVGATTMGLAADTDLVTFSNGTLTIAGTVAATTLTGAGAGITALAAANITASGTLPALNGAALTALNGTQVTTGTLPAARIADDSIVEGKLNVSNGPTNGQVLTARDGVAGGFTWEAASAGATLSGSTNNTIVTVTGSNAMIGEAGLTFDASAPTLKIRGESGAPATSGTTELAVLRLNPTGVTGTIDMGFHADATGRGWIQSTDTGNLGTNYTLSINPNGGNVGIGTTAATGHQLFVSKSLGGDDVVAFRNTHDSIPQGIEVEFSAAAPDNNSQTFLNLLDNASARLRVWSDGDVVNHDNSYGSLSDERKKENIVDMPNTLSELNKLRMRQFSWKNDNLSEPNMYGIVAQEALASGATLPEKFIKEDGEGFYSAYYSHLIPMLVKAVQELKAEVDALKG